MKKVIIATVALILICLIVTYVMAGRGSIVVENRAGKSIEQLLIEIDGSQEVLKSDFRNGDLITLPFDARTVESIQISAILKDSILSRGTIEPGMFANLKAQILPDGTIDFGKTRFPKSNITFGDWASTTAD